MKIPVCKPVISKTEEKYVLECLRTNWISSMGRFIGDFEDSFAGYCSRKYGIATTSGTTALHLALESLGLKEGDEVILPTFTMIAPAFAVCYCRAKIVPVDICPDTYNIDFRKIEEKVTLRTKAIMVVHIYGHPCDMGPILKVANKHNLFLIEDAAEAHGAEYRGRRVGSFGDVSCFSFYANKIITSGEGGMVLTNNKRIAMRARYLKNLAFSKTRFFHRELGYNYRMSNILAAIGLAQLEKINKYISARRRNAFLYSRGLKDIEGLQLPVEKEYARNVYWMYGIVLQDEFGPKRESFMKKLKDRGIETRAFFVPMHKQPVFKKMGYSFNDKFPVADYISSRGLYLPSGNGLTERQISYIIDTIRRIKE
ncbi:MAG: DegT/DnrJ/EryC1/StrS family aminotransferase [Candidatus Omnitrophota bacterium]